MTTDKDYKDYIDGVEDQPDDEHIQWLNQGRREAVYQMANELMDQERRLYKAFADNPDICVGIKLMAEEIRRYYDS